MRSVRHPFTSYGNLLVADSNTVSPRLQISAEYEETYM
uniref:Uncharacterized protein n=1 Tax=Arundo donax TaxID=35708 RepID=A0A0A9HBJ4_ARUDO